MYGGFRLFQPILRIMEVSHLSSENTEVSVFFTDGWQHCDYVLDYLVLDGQIVLII